MPPTTRSKASRRRSTRLSSLSSVTSAAATSSSVVHRAAASASSASASTSVNPRRYVSSPPSKSRKPLQHYVEVPKLKRRQRVSASPTPAPEAKVSRTRSGRVLVNPAATLCIVQNKSISSRTATTTTTTKKNKVSSLRTTTSDGTSISTRSTRHKPAPPPCTCPNSAVEQRERALADRETELDARANRLHERRKSIRARERTLVETMNHRQAVLAFKQIQDNFTCAMCYEPLADPHTLTTCGHTFCALCALKLYFSRLHEACGAWHDLVLCPICRTPLVLPGEKVPRGNETFPFVRNLVLCSVLGDIVGDLESCVDVSGALAAAGGEVGCEEVEAEMASWGSRGCARKEWQTRSRENRDVIDNLRRTWPFLTSVGFVGMKQRLQV